MPQGKEIAKFDMQSTSITVSALPGGGRRFQLNLEGSVTGAWDGTALITMIADSNDLVTGTFTNVVAGYLNDGGVVTGTGSGTLQSTGGHKWRLRGTDLTSDGKAIVTEGVLDLATRKFSGSIYE